MLNRILLCFSTLTLVSFASFAQTVEPTPTNEPASTVPRGEGSEFNRTDKKFTLHALLIGVGPNPSISSGIGAGMFLDRNSLVDIEYVSGRPYDWYGFYTDYEIVTKSYGVHYKRFVSNTFYFRVGADYRQVDYRYTSRSLFSSSIYSENKFNGESVVGTIVIGNQWQFENFTLGCDWFGVALPVTRSIKSESSTGTNPDTVKLSDDEDRYVRKTTAMGLRFYLGASF